MTLSVTESESVACVEVVQNMMFAYRVLESMELKVKLPLVVEVDNKGAVDIANSWTATGRTRHIATRINFLRELKETCIVSVQWISSVIMAFDTFTRNLGGQDFYLHRDKYVRDDPSVRRIGAETISVPVGEGVGVCVHPRDAGAEHMQRTGPRISESPIGVSEGVTGGVSDRDETGDEHVASVVVAREGREHSHSSEEKSTLVEKIPIYFRKAKGTYYYFG
jgi:hypothetical protein